MFSLKTLTTGATAAALIAAIGLAYAQVAGSPESKSGSDDAAASALPSPESSTTSGATTAPTPSATTPGSAAPSDPAPASSLAPNETMIDEPAPRADRN